MPAAPLVVKLGGSHAGSALLRPWLRAIEAAAGRVVLVPGGGPFAEAVRDAQAVMGFDGTAADEMALLAMTQFGRALAALGACCVMAETLAEIARAQRSARVPVWSPLALRRQATRLPRSWDVTSDSLAAWLAARLGARLLLIKQMRPQMRPGSGATLHGLAQAGLVDRAFPLAAAGLGAVWIAGPDDRPHALDPDAPPGVAVPAIAAAA